MRKKMKAPETIYLQWSGDPHDENTWCENRITDDDVVYVRSDVGKPAQIIALNSLIERLVEAIESGDNIRIRPRADVDAINLWWLRMAAVVSEWQAIKKENAK